MFELKVDHQNQRTLKKVIKNNAFVSNDMFSYPNIT